MANIRQNGVALELPPPLGSQHCMFTLFRRRKEMNEFAETMGDIICSTQTLDEDREQGVD